MSEIDRLLGALGDPKKRVRRQAAEALALHATDDAALRARLAAELSTADPQRRWIAAYTLYLAGDRSERLWPAFLAALGSDDGDLRWATARLAIHLDLEDLDRRFMAAAAGGPGEQRKMALYCLRDRAVRSPEIEACARGALAAGEAGVRLAALSALAAVCVDAGRAAESMAALLGDPDAGVRRAAAASLGKLGVVPPAVADALAAAACGADEALARAARSALDRLGSAT
jgi:HEAT repeat protein